MKLTVPETARLLSVPEATVYRWVREGTIPFARVNEQVRFNRADILEWATERGMPVSVEIFPSGGGELRLSEALETGGVHHGVGGDDPATVLGAIVALMDLDESVDRESLLEILLAREAVGSTGVGDGIAIPHVSKPLVLEVDRPTLMLCFLAEPVDFHAIDGQPVTTVFLTLSPTVRLHLQVLSRLSAALHDPGFRGAIARRAPREEILAEARRVDDELPAAPAQPERQAKA
jgi:PTS system nitrogen regulatory IIA component